MDFTLSDFNPDLINSNSIYIENKKLISVIDIGSNSVRLVVYASYGRVAETVFNEKILCGLGRDLMITGKLSIDGYNRCIKILQRFHKISVDMQVSHIDIIATAAVREAMNGQDLINDIVKICGVTTRILSGDEEAKLSALGIISASPDADGMVADLGGGSMELITINKGQIGDKNISLKLGPLRQWNNIQKGHNHMVNIIDMELDKIAWLNDITGKSLYIIGGVWRSLAKLHMEYINYPLHIIHNYQINFTDAIDFTDYIAKISLDELKVINNGSNLKRAEILPYAALLLNRLLHHTSPQEILFSAYSIREGCLFDNLPNNIRKLDPLIEACKLTQRIKVNDPMKGDILADWIKPAFLDSSINDRLRLAICYISDIGRGEHPDYRADHAMMRVLRYPYIAITHKERALVALAVSARYGNKIRAMRSIKSVKKLLLKNEENEAKSIGKAIRLAYNISGGVNSSLIKFKLERRDDMLIINCPVEYKYMIGEIAQKHLSDLSKLLDCQWQIKLH